VEAVPEAAVAPVPEVAAEAVAVAVAEPVPTLLPDPGDAVAVPTEPVLDPGLADTVPEAPAVAEPEGEPKPKKRGWWSLGR
jgi:ribonuclease E